MLPLSICFVLVICQFVTALSEPVINQTRCKLKEFYPLEAYYCESNENTRNSQQNELHESVQVGQKCVFQEQNGTVLVTRICNAQGWHDTDTEYVEPRDRTPPVLKCPLVAPRLADPIQINTVVTWTEPTAQDDRDGNIRPRRSGPQPDVLFSEGTTRILYFARDRSGNSRTCHVDIVVKVVRCPTLSPMNDGYYVCHPSSDMVQGTSCHFGCYRGHQLKGRSSIECIGHMDYSVGRWSTQQPVCERLQCKRLPPVLKPLHMKCTDTNYYRSICSFSCDPGYDIVPGQTRVMLCTEYGNWRGSIPKCRDSEPPSFKKCIGYQVGFTDRGTDSGKISTFHFPLVNDNVDKNIVPKLTSATNPKNRLKTGVYDISYSAVDHAGNNAINCSIKLVMKVITCPTIYPTADTSVTCTTGSRYGSACDFACGSYATLNGSQTVSCQRINHKSYGKWNWVDQQPFCEVAKRCTEQLHTPSNGALACDYWLGGKFCHMYCRDRYDIPMGVSVGNDMYVCGKSGKWSPSSLVPDCARVVGSRHIHYRLNIEFHFSGNCHDRHVVLEIKEKFINHWKTTAYKEGCLHDINHCIPSNIQVECGGISGKRSTSLRIEFDVEMEAHMEVDNDIFKNMTLQQYSTLQSMKKAINNGEFTIELEGNSTLYARDLTYTLLGLDCQDGTAVTKNHQSCAKCASGTFFEKLTKQCKECPRGTYQPAEGQMSCHNCPLGKTTTETGTSDSNKCKDACSPGTWAVNGIPPCSYCSKGTYQDKYGGIECKVCPGALTTELDGSTSSSDCKEFDIHMMSSNAFLLKEFNFPSVSEIDIRFWLKILELQSGNTFMQLDVEGVCLIKISYGNGVLGLEHNGLKETKAVNLTLGKWLYSSILLSASTVKLSFGKDSLEYHHTAISISGKANLQIGKGFTGRISQLNIFSVHAVNIPPGRCFNNVIGDILSWKIFEETLVQDVFVHVPSECDDVNECDSNPCINGKCTDELNSYSCQCHYGFYGNQCQHNIDDCGDNACDNNGTCIDGAASYKCDCPHDYTGKLCEIKMVDGDWSEWGNWSSCSVSCGNGTMSRKRLCNNPTPDNGGIGCLGNETEYGDCAEEECPVCPWLIEPENTVLVCDNDTRTDTVNCTLRCQPGYDFDHEPKAFYFCGPETLHQWDFQTVDNPLIRLPSCTEFRNASVLKIGYNATYADLICDYSAKSENAEQEITHVLKQASGDIGCVKDSTCTITQLDVINCTNNRRQKRDASLEKAGFRSEFGCDSANYGSEQCHRLLLHAFENMVNQTIQKLLDSDVENHIYPIDPQSLKVDTSVVCKEGMTPVDFRCVPCSKGRYETSGRCELCHLGTYQHQTGQTNCYLCPENKSTLGKGSTNVNDCTAAVNGIIIGLVCATSILLFVVLGFVLRRNVRRNPKIIDFSFSTPQLVKEASKPVFNIHELKTIKGK